MHSFNNANKVCSCLIIIKLPNLAIGHRLRSDSKEKASKAIGYRLRSDSKEKASNRS